MAAWQQGDGCAAYSPPSAGPPPWYLDVVTPTTAFGAASSEPLWRDPLALPGDGGLGRRAIGDEHSTWTHRVVPEPRRRSCFRGVALTYRKFMPIPLA